MKRRILHMVFNQAKKLPPLIAELQSLANEFEQVLVLPSYDQDPDYLATLLPGIRIRYIRLRTREWSAAQTPLLKLLRFMEFSFKAMVVVADEKTDIAVAHDMPAVLPLLPRLATRPCNVVYNAHELWSEAAEENAPLRSLWHALERWVVRNAGRTVVPEPNRADILLKEYGARKMPVVLRNIPATPGPLLKSNVLRERLNLSADDRIVLYQGLLADSRALVPLLQAMPLLPNHVHLVLAGQGEELFEQQLRESAQKAAGRVHFLEWMPPDELSLITAAADVGVLLYTDNGRNNYYAAPNKLYEYLFAGLPVVSSNFPGLRKIVEGSEYGYCADPEKETSIVAAIQDALRMQSGEAIASRAREEFRWEDDLASLRDLYHELTELRHGC